MVVGTNALFTAPIAGDKIFIKLCMKGDIMGHVERYYGKKLSNDLGDLLKSMLRADPKQRLSLEEVMEHPWLANNESVKTPTECRLHSTHNFSASY